MTEADRLRAQADRCAVLAKVETDKTITGALFNLATKSLEQASELEHQANERRRL
jgi:hypothetical protein